MNVLVVFGTRPEAIKMCPLVYKLKEAEGIDCVVCLTGQHKEMLSRSWTPLKLRRIITLVS